MSLFGRKEKEEINLLKKGLAFACDMLKDERATHEWNAELLRQMLIFKNQKIAELEESKELIRQEKLRMEDRVEELKQELLNERERADRYADACSASMEYGWGPVPEEKMIVAGFTKTESGWQA